MTFEFSPEALIFQLQKDIVFLKEKEQAAQTDVVIQQQKLDEHNSLVPNDTSTGNQIIVSSLFSGITSARQTLELIQNEIKDKENQIELFEKDAQVKNSRINQETGVNESVISNFQQTIDSLKALIENKNISSAQPTQTIMQNKKSSNIPIIIAAIILGSAL